MNLTTEQKKAAALIFAAEVEGKQIEWNQFAVGWVPVNPFHSEHRSSVFLYPQFYRIAPDPIAPGWNPDKLTVAQVGEGWRLLDEDERVDAHSQKWWDAVEANWSVTGWGKSTHTEGYKCGIMTYRTRLTRAELAALDAPPFDLRNLPGFRTLLPGEQWHRNDWTREMLPDGWRPLLSTECAKPGDQYGNNEFVFDTQHHEDSTPEKSHNGNILWVRTQRPLPPIPTRRPWTFENGPLSLKVRTKKEHWQSVAILHSASGYAVGLKFYDFASMLENFECLDGEPCGTVTP